VLKGIVHECMGVGVLWTTAQHWPHVRVRPWTLPSRTLSVSVVDSDSHVRRRLRVGCRSKVVDSTTPTLDMRRAHLSLIVRTRHSSPRHSLPLPHLTRAPPAMSASPSSAARSPSPATTPAPSPASSDNLIRHYGTFLAEVFWKMHSFKPFLEAEEKKRVEGAARAQRKGLRALVRSSEALLQAMEDLDDWVDLDCPTDPVDAQGRSMTALSTVSEPPPPPPSPSLAGAASGASRIPSPQCQ
jgi:hypothetical protein